MIIYNVTISILDPLIENEWLKWMKETHIPDVMNTKMFLDYKICKVVLEDECTYAIQYTCINQSKLDEYLTHFAPKLMQEHSQKYNGKFGAFRTFLNVIDQSK
jgi:hypothetical protein